MNMFFYYETPQQQRGKMRGQNEMSIIGTQKEKKAREKEREKEREREREREKEMC
jgi:hypothetical protein